MQQQQQDFYLGFYENAPALVAFGVGLFILHVACEAIHTAYDILSITAQIHGLMHIIVDAKMHLAIYIHEHVLASGCTLDVLLDLYEDQEAFIQDLPRSPEAINYYNYIFDRGHQLTLFEDRMVHYNPDYVRQGFYTLDLRECYSQYIEHQALIDSAANR